MRLRYDSILRAVSRMAWAMDPARGQEMLSLLELRAAGGLVPADEVRRIAAQNKRPASQTVGATAVVPVYGVLAPRMNMLTDISGGTSMELLGAQLAALAADPGVGTIVLDIDSPGGTTTGLPELCAQIAQIRAQGTRVIAAANHLAASAAYWLACAADEIVASPSAEVGSIGVFSVHTDASQAYADEGIRHTVIKAGPYKAEGLPIEPLTPEARAAMQQDVNYWYGQFVTAVARGRGVQPATVEQHFGQGRTVSAPDALAAGMVDRLEPMDQTLARLAGPTARRVSAPRAAFALMPPRDRAAALVDWSMPGYLIDTTPRTGAPWRILPALAFTHEWANVAPNEPDWGSIDKTALPREAFADRGEPDTKSSWGYPHHWVKGGTTKDDDGIWTDGTLYVHTGGVNAAWSAANGGRSGQKASEAVLAHLEHHRKALGLDTANSSSARATTDGAVADHGAPPPISPALVAMEHTVPPEHSTVAPSGAIPNEPDAAVRAERQRSSDILALCREHGVSAEDTQTFIARGLSVGEASQEILKLKRAERAHAAPVISGVADRAAAQPFGTLGEQLYAIVRASRTEGRTVDPRLNHIAAASGMSEAVPSDGGFMLQPDFAQEIITRAYDTGEILSRVRRRPIGASSNGLKINAIDESSRADGQRLGGVQTFWANEADTATQKKPKLRQMELNLKKLIGIWYLTDELIEDQTALTAFAMDAFSEEVTFVTENAIVNGDGVGKPFGIMNSAALVTVAKESAQAAQTFVAQNAAKMYARMWARSRQNMVWILNQDVEPQLLTMTLGGTTAIPIFVPAGGFSGQPFATLLGKPLIAVEYCQTLGTPGDIIAVDLDQYLLIDKGGPKQAQSLHVRFLNDEMTFRITYRVDGQPIWNTALTPKNGVNTLSPYVVLATR